MRRHVSYKEQNVSNNLKHLLLDEVIVAVEFATVFQASGPGKNAGDGVGAGRPSLKNMYDFEQLHRDIYFNG